MLRISLLGLLLLAMSVLGYADGMLMPVRPEEPRFSVAYHKVKVDIDHQVASTDIDQAFHNNSSRAIEATYIFPLGEGMSISKFAMYANNEPLSHRILEKEEAAKIYNGIVAARRDPALLEWLGSRMIQARVFPIAPGEDKRIRIAYQEVLKAEGGVVKYVYPLKTEKMSSRNLEQCSVDITIHSALPIRSVYSPTHPVKVDRLNETTAHVTYQERNVLPDQDLVLYYTVSDKAMGVDLIASRDPARGDGYFLLLVSPKAEVRDDEVQPKDVVLVLDRSGSMAADSKIEQARNALKFCLNSLDRRDRFGLITFNDDIRCWNKILQPATRENVKEAEGFVNDIRADGSTNINEAMHSALALLGGNDGEAARPRIVIMLTDGLPTTGEVNTETILTNVRRENTHRARIFNFGVGYDLNAHFLDKLANDNHGVAENVLPKEDIEAKVSGFFSKVSSPLLMNLAMNWGDTDVYDLYPKEMPDLFKGSQLLLTGRYKPRHGGEATHLRLSGQAMGRQQSFDYAVTFPAATSGDEFIPRLWATRKIGYLEDQARLNGVNKEIMEEIIKLSKEFGILTEYTSFLVDIDERIAHGPVGKLGTPLPSNTFTPTYGAAGSVVTITGTNLLGAQAATVGGSSGVAQSMNRKNAKNAQQAASSNGNSVYDANGRLVQLSQMRNISQRSFVQAGTQWVDVNYRESLKVMKVKAFSPAYFQLVNAHPRMALFLSQNAQVTVALKAVAIQVGPEGRTEEFKAAELTDLKHQIVEELGKPEPSKQTKAPASTLHALTVAAASVTPGRPIGWIIPMILSLLALDLGFRMRKRER